MSETTSTEVFKALGDPIRWNIVQQIAAVDELACSVLEDTLPVSKPTISYHTKILAQAGLLSVHKRGRNYFYTLRRDVLQELADEMWALVPGPRAVRAGQVDHTSVARARRGRAVLRPAVGDDSTEHEATLLTW